MLIFLYFLFHVKYKYIITQRDHHCLTLIIVNIIYSIRLVQNFAKFMLIKYDILFSFE